MHFAPAKRHDNAVCLHNIWTSRGTTPARDLRQRWSVSPGGHFVTTVAACAVTAAATGSWPLTAAVAAGGFLIDVDHAIDYVLVERQRDLRPSAFLRYYVDGRVRRTVLVLHSYEVFVSLIALAFATGSDWLGGYLVGALMHLALDITFNGKRTPYSIVAFYSFGYRLAHRFDADRLLGLSPTPVPSRSFWLAFFANGSPPDTVLDSADGCEYLSSRTRRIWARSSTSSSSDSAISQ
jgi:hypothetical protein